MKKLKFLMLLGLPLLFGETKGQAYIPLAIDSAQWVIANDYVETPYYIDNLFGYRINGDTVINGYKYKKVYRRSFTSLNGDYFPPYIVHEGSLFGVVRDSVAQEKVYAIRFDNWATSCPANEEYLMYDFSLNIGDSIEGLCQFLDQSLYIDNVYEDYYAGILRKHWVIWGACDVIVEGVGSQQGLFETSGCALSGVIGSLYTYCQGSDEQCLSGFLANVDDINEQQDVISVFPNPVKDILNIRINTSDKSNITVIIKNVISGEFGRLSVCEPEQTIDFSQYPNGIYFLSVFQNNKFISVKKIIKI